jgi:hypothetical protein
MYFEEVDDERLEEIKRAIGTDKDAVATRYAIRNVPLPRQ